MDRPNTLGPERRHPTPAGSEAAAGVRPYGGHVAAVNQVEVLTEVRQRPVLMIGEAPGFLEGGGVIRFVIEGIILTGRGSEQVAVERR